MKRVKKYKTILKGIPVKKLKRDGGVQGWNVYFTNGPSRALPNTKGPFLIRAKAHLD